MIFGIVVDERSMVIGLNPKSNMEGVINRYPDVDVVSQGVATLQTFHISEDDAQRANLATLFARGHYFERVYSGDYVKLYVEGQLMMSDTHMERLTNQEFVHQAHGKVMIAGLGIGLILNALQNKIQTGEVTSIVIYEKYQDVIEIVGPRYKDLPLEIRCEDILTYRPQKDEKYDTIYFDIWPSVCSDNLEQIAMLHQRWKTHKEKGGWMSSWMVDYLRQQRKEEQRQRYYW